MKDYVILVDATCDLNDEIRNEYGIEYINSHVVFKDGKDIKAELSFDAYKEYYASSKEFYNDLKKDPDSFKTSPASPDEVALAFEKYYKEGKDVIAITISSSLSGTYEFMNLGKKTFLEKYPDGNVEIIDSRRFGAGYGLIAIYAAMKRNEGLKLEETVKWIEDNKNTFHQTGWLDDLSFVAKKGRLTHAKAFFGTLVGIKPLGEFDSNGLTTVIGKAKGEKAAYDALIKYMKEEVVNPSEQIMLVIHSQRERQARKYMELIEENFKPKKIYFLEQLPSCGINVGPGLMTVYYVGKATTENLVEEKALMESILTA